MERLVLHKSTNNISFTKQRIFVVIEGLDGVGKSTVSRQLAKDIGANLFHTPDSRLDEIRPIFDNSSIATRTAYYYACNYLVSDQIEYQLKTKSAILDRYYGSTIAASYSHGLIEESILKNKVNEISSKLLSPNLIVHLELPENERISRMHNRGDEFNRDEKKLMIDHDFRNRFLKALDIVSNITINISGLTPVEISSLIIRELNNRQRQD
jgi:dTMP kinase